MLAFVKQEGHMKLTDKERDELEAQLRRNRNEQIWWGLVIVAQLIIIALGIALMVQGI